MGILLAFIFLWSVTDALIVLAIFRGRLAATLISGQD
jgi:hypothetical protein